MTRPKAEGCKHELGESEACDDKSRRTAETHGQLEFLRSLGCDIAQEYLFSKPLPG